MRITKSSLVGLAVALAVLASQSPAKQPPNVVIIYADDMGYGDLACQNPEAKLTTPNLDRLASEGVRFTDAHSSSGICSPSRFALLTGQYHWRRQHGIVNSMGPSMFKDGDVTLPMVLKQRGYQTVCIGKWHLGWDWNALLRPDLRDQAQPNGRRKDGKPFAASDYDWDQPVPAGPCSVGFDHYFGDGTINFPPYCWIEDDRVVVPPLATMTPKYLQSRVLKTHEGRWEFRPGPMAKGWDPYEVLPTLADRADGWLRDQSGDQPFFLYFALPSPHAPIIPNDEYLGKTDAGAYGDFVFQTDAVVGRVLDALEATGAAKNTLVVFTSDNGPEKYAFARFLKLGHSSAGPLRGLKRDVWEGGHRVPFVVRWPSRAPNGAVCEHLVSQIDLFRTITGAAGAVVPGDAARDGLDLTPLLESPSRSEPVRTTLVHNTYPNIWGLRRDDWLYIDGPTGTHSKAPAAYRDARGYTKTEKGGLLFDMAEDVGQLNNVHDANLEVAGAMRRTLSEIRGDR